jgi:hypothetical protein
MTRRTQKGSVFAYILAAILLMGILVMTLTTGPQKASTSAKIDEMTAQLDGDVMAITSAIMDCTLQYPAPADNDASGVIDAADNPNPPYPIYAASGTMFGSTGILLSSIRCPGASGKPLVFGNKAGRNVRIMADTTNYSVMYFNDATESVMLRISRPPAVGTSTPWTEAIGRLEEKYAECKAAVITAADGTCDNGCFYYWITRTDASVIGTTGNEAACLNL